MVLITQEVNEVIPVAPEVNEVVLATQEVNEVVPIAQEVAKDTQTKGLITKALAATKSLAPSSIYDPKKAKKKRMMKIKKGIYPDLFTIWRNATTILAPVQVSSTTSSITYPTVDWSQVNVRSLANIPTPTALPIHGCSFDPSHYEKIKEMGYHGWQWRSSKFEEPCPFGHLPGYQTDVGPIAFSSQVVFGHVWSVTEHKWILHASTKKEGAVRKPGGRRREKK